MPRKKGKKKGRYPPAGATAAAFSEVKANEPGVVGKTRKKFGKKRAAKQKVAIALSKARKASGMRRYKST